MTGLDDTIKEFLIESHENLDRLDRDLIVLEQDPRHLDSLSSIFRTIHTIKGTCGFFGFGKLSALTHAGESLLSQVRDGKRSLDAAATTVLLAMVDAIRGILRVIEQSGGEGTDDVSRLSAQIAAMAKGESNPTAVSCISTVSNPVAFDVTMDTGASLTDGTIRVELGLLDRLMNLVGELVLARNQILQLTSLQKDAAFQGTTQRLNSIATELQESVMKTRLQPIAAVWSKFPRLCRDLGVACGKKVVLAMEGRETELDKSIIEAIKDPLTHLIRNAIDHGLESPEQRRRLGKPAEGHLVIRAYHESGQVNIEVSDDGAGIDPQRVRRKAGDRGLISSAQMDRMTDREVLQLIFLPGFSTTDAVTNVSGRGVGMDVVKTNIEKISGNVDLVSVVGNGTTVKLKIPLTLAIIPALLVTCEGDAYAIPQSSLLELVRIEADQIPYAIEDIRGASVHRLRGNLLPLVYLRDVLGVGGNPKKGEAANIVVLQADDRPFGLVVDAINDTEEIVVKPLGKHLKGVSIYAGATILGDGRVALILDVLGVAQNANVIGENRERTSVDRAADPIVDGTPCQTLLLVSVGRDRRFAIALSQVTRLEEIPHSSVEYSFGGEVLQYWGGIIPLLRLSKLLGIADSPEHVGDRLPIIIYSGGAQTVGLIADRILDIVETPVDLHQTNAGTAGVRGSAVIQGRVAQLLDPALLLRSSAAHSMAEAFA